MRITVAADTNHPSVDAVVAWAQREHHDVTRLDPVSWPDAGRAAGEAVAFGVADMAVVLCWTGTGVSIAANKVPGVHAALCGDAYLAAGARRWNDANVLALSMRSTSIAMIEEILEAFVTTEVDDDHRATIADVEAR